MTDKSSRSLRSPILIWIKSSTSIVIATGIFAAIVDTTYVKLRSLRIVHDVAAHLERSAHKTPNRRTHLRLDVGGDAFAVDPHPSLVKIAVMTAANESGRNRFLVLARSPDEFIQAAVTKEGWLLEFRAELGGSGAMPMLFRCRNTVDRRVIIRALQFYRAGDRAWGLLCPWVSGAL